MPETIAADPNRMKQPMITVAPRRQLRRPVSIMKPTIATAMTAIDVATLPYPGIATDYKPLIITMLSVADGVGIVTENLYPGRFRYVEELQRLGADIRTDGHHAVVRGVPRLSSAPVWASDIRAGAGLALAALCADGVTQLWDVDHIDRGYPRFVQNLSSLGADIARVAGEPAP